VPDDVFIIDAVVHAFNLSRENLASKYGEQLYHGAYMMHAGWNPPGVCVEGALYRDDMSIEALAQTVFLESQATLAVTHTLTLNSWFKDGFCSEAKTVEATTRWPERFYGYVGVDPTQDPARYLADFDRQVATTPQAIGLKLYPHQIDPFRRWRTEDDRVLGLFARARDAGLKLVGIHKALPNGTVPLGPYKPDDVDVAADAFPDLAFEIVHGGMAFLEETTMAVASYPNVYVNLETTTCLLWRAPGLFEDILAQLLFWGGPEKIFFASGVALVHPQPLIELFWNMRFSDETLRKYGIPQLDEATKRAILGLNYARVAGIDVEKARAAARNDAFARAKQAHGGLFAPFSRWPAVHAGRALV
jgi:predicted TIM-barrel fold metal-dependent hydrolase